VIFNEHPCTGVESMRRKAILVALETLRTRGEGKNVIRSTNPKFASMVNEQLGPEPEWHAIPVAPETHLSLCELAKRFATPHPKLVAISHGDAVNLAQLRLC
jgi:hypothetical protein